jgi:glycerol-3-phosphate dehydrogenase (NAD(P)+)
MALAQRHDVLLWGRNAPRCRRPARENSYLPGYPFPDRLQWRRFRRRAGPRGRARQPADCRLPGGRLAAAAAALKGRAIPNVVWLCKGFEYDTGLLPHQIVREVLGDTVAGGALSGPSFAQEVAKGLPCALTIASDSAALRASVVETAHGGNMRVYSSEDLVGVEVGGAVKRAGDCHRRRRRPGPGPECARGADHAWPGGNHPPRRGAGRPDRNLHGPDRHGRPDPDLHGRPVAQPPRRPGLAQGKPLEQIVQELGHVAEGVPCAKAVRELAAKLGVDMPITNAVAGVLFDGDQPQAMVPACSRAIRAARNSAGFRLRGNPSAQANRLLLFLLVLGSRIHATSG